MNRITGWWSENKTATDEVSNPAWEIVGKCWKYFARSPSTAILHFNVESRKTKLDALMLPCIKGFPTQPRRHFQHPQSTITVVIFQLWETLKKKFLALSRHWIVTVFSVHTFLQCNSYNRHIMEKINEKKFYYHFACTILTCVLIYVNETVMKIIFLKLECRMKKLLLNSIINFLNKKEIKYTIYNFSIYIASTS